MKTRILLLAGFIFLLFSLLIAQFFHTQIIEGEKWTKIANGQHSIVVKEPFRRGTFYSNTGVQIGHPQEPVHFVADIQKYHLHVDSLAIPEQYRQEFVGALQECLHLEKADEEFCARQLEKKSRNRRLTAWLEEEEKERVLVWWKTFAKQKKLPRNALFFIADYKRCYPFGSLLGQVLHTVQEVKDEETGQAIPTGGLELRFQEALKGKMGKRRLMRSPRNNFETGEVISAPQDGANVYLTINHVLQAIAEEELMKGVKRVKAKNGWAVMMDPFTGEILALAQYPFFYPPDYQRYFSDPVLIEQIKVKAATDAYEPGSTFKAITAAIALKANVELVSRNEPPLFDPDEKMPTANGYFPGRGGKPLKDTRLHRFLNFDMAMMKSSNVYMARLVERIINRLGNDWYRQELLAFGLGTKTGIELPSETPGVVPKPGRKHVNGTLEWSKATPYSLAMGHNIQVSTLQLVRAFSVFANGGFLVQPTLVRKIAYPGNKQEEKMTKEPAKRVLPADVASKVARAMKYTTKLGGTARRADIFGFTECGKTGTGNKVVNGAYSDYHVCSSFVGFAPFDHPKFVLAVAMDEPEYGFIPGIGKNHHGGTCSAPVFRDIAKRALEYMGVSPDDPHGYPAGDPRADPSSADWVMETRQLQEMYEKWNN